MASVADIQTSIWPDLEDLSDDAALLYIWAFSNPSINPAGLYKVARRNLCEGRLTPDRLDAALTELADGRFLFYVDGVIWIRTHVKHYRSKTPQAAKSIAKTLRQIAGHHLADAFVAEYANLPGFPELTDRLNNLGTESVTPAPAAAPADPPPTSPLRAVEQDEPTARTVKHNGKTVPADKLRVAEAILASLNTQAGTSYGAYKRDGTPSENLKRILSAVTDEPDIDEQTGAKMIAFQLANPYWTGPVDAGNIFGPGVREKGLQAARSNGTGSHDEARLAKALR